MQGIISGVIKSKKPKDYTFYSDNSPSLLFVHGFNEFAAFGANVDIQLPNQVEKALDRPMVKAIFELGNDQANDGKLKLIEKVKVGTSKYSGWREKTTNLVFASKLNKIRGEIEETLKDPNQAILDFLKTRPGLEKIDEGRNLYLAFDGSGNLQLTLKEKPQVSPNVPPEEPGTTVPPVAPEGESTEVQKAEKALEERKKASIEAHIPFQKLLNQNEAYNVAAKAESDAWETYYNARKSSNSDDDTFRKTSEGEALYKIYDDLGGKRSEAVNIFLADTPLGQELYDKWKKFNAAETEAEESLKQAKVKAEAAPSPTPVPGVSTGTGIPFVPDTTAVQPPSEENKPGPSLEDLQALVKGLPDTTPPSTENKNPETGGERNLSAEEQQRLKELHDLFDNPSTDPDQGNNPKP